MSRPGLLRNRDGAAAAELALVLPLLLTILFGSLEMGRFFWSEHQLVQAVRDASVFASRQRIDHFDCAAGTVDSAVTTPVTNLVRTGELSGGTDRLPNWTDAAASVNVTLACVTAAGGTNLSGMYRTNDNVVPVITVAASVPYHVILGGFGMTGAYSLNASQQSAVMGI